MPITLDTLAAQVRRALSDDPGHGGRARAAALLSQALQDRAFVAAQFAVPAGERRLAYEDPQLGFCILLHEYDAPRDGRPHDHGPSWAVYGQAEGESVMHEFERLDPGHVRRLRSITMRPGDVRLYQDGDVHAVTHRGPARLVRIEGRDLAQVRRGTYAEQG